MFFQRLERAVLLVVSVAAGVGFSSWAWAGTGQSPDPSFVFVPTAGGGPTDRFGTSLASGGDVVVIGSPQRPFTTESTSNNAQGALTIFGSTGSDGSYMAEATLVDFFGKPSDFLGTSVAYKGAWAVGGAPGFDVYVAGLPLPNQLQAGGVLGWKYDGASWVGPVFFTHPAPRANDFFGSAVAMQREFFGDGSTRQSLVIGAPTDDAAIASGGNRLDCGSVSVWELKGDTWFESAFIEMPVMDGETDASTAGALFGTAVRFDGKHLLVGAKRASPTVSSQGVVYVFRRSSDSDPPPQALGYEASWGEWVLVQRIVAETPQANDQFGTAIDAQQGCLLVGAPNRGTTSVPNTGAAYIYRKDLATELYVWEASLIAADAQSGDLFGAAVAVWADSAVVGAPGVDIGLPPTQIANRGTVYLFATDPVSCGAWTQRTEYAPPLALATPDASFGSAVHLHADEVLIGSPRAPGPVGVHQGSAMAFEIDTVGCAFDLGGDGFVDGLDVGLFFSHWAGTTPEHFVADFDGNLVVESLDLTYLLSHWGPCGCEDPAPPP